MPRKPKDATPTIDPDTLSDDGHSEFVNTLLEYAQGLRREQEDLLKRKGANREALRNMLTMHTEEKPMLSEKQAHAIAQFYPERTKDSKGDDTNGDAPAAS